MNKINYQKKMEEIIAHIDIVKESQPEGKGHIPTLFLHSCCGPCSSYVLECLSGSFSITLFYYNPNISPREEYEKRVMVQKDLIRQIPVKNPVSFIEGDYEQSAFLEMSKGLEHEPEGGLRCFGCYRMRLSVTAREAKQRGFDYFTTALTISPLKNAAKINEIGEELALEYSVSFLPGDFKKKNGYKRSIELSREFGLYRQNYCGCAFCRHG